jgi:hypothetical protein
MITSLQVCEEPTQLPIALRTLLAASFGLLAALGGLPFHWLSQKQGNQL